MKNNKETTKEEFLESMNELAKSYDESNISNKKDGSSTQQQSFNNGSESKSVRSINSLTDQEYRRMFEESHDLYD